MAAQRGRRRWLLALAVVAALVVWEGTRDEAGGGGVGPTASSPPGAASPSSTSAPDQSGTPTTVPVNQDPAQYAQQVVTHADAAGVNPVLVMAILYNESYKPHDPALERAWQQIDPDAGFGIANMHQAAFDDAKEGRDFADRDWEELPDDPELAIQAAAWFLHDLAAQVPQEWSGQYTRDELLALGYNAGAGNMLAFADGARPGGAAQSYLDRLRDNWPAAEDAIRQGG